jgi:hypothetical protein
MQHALIKPNLPLLATLTILCLEISLHIIQHIIWQIEFCGDSIFWKKMFVVKHEFFIFRIKQFVLVYLIYYIIPLPAFPKLSVMVWL